MELIDRYIKTLKSGLPEAQKEDIARELSENIYSEIEDKEAELGRSLSSAEVEAVLKQHGNPLVVASRYRQDQRSLAFGRQLIGPTLFPYYLKVLAFNLGLTATVILIILTALMAGGKPVDFHEGASTLFWNLLIQFSVITMIFSVVDRHLTKHPDRWDIGKPSRAGFTPEVSPAEKKPAVPRMESVSRLVALAVFVAWLRAIRNYPFLIFGPAGTFLRAAPVWHEMYAPVVLVAVVGMVQSGINLLRPDWLRLRNFVRVATGIMELMICFFLIKAGAWLIATGGASQGYQRAAVIVNRVVFYSLLVAVVIKIAELVRDVRRLISQAANSSTRTAAANT